MADMKNDDGVIRESVVDAVGVAGGRQNADARLACDNANLWRVAQSIYAFAQMFAHALGRGSVCVLNEVVADVEKIAPVFRVFRRSLA